MVDPKTIYLESDEEVTSVIDKLRKTEFKDVVLVVPKEAGLLHSIVNLKLIKRQAEALGKSVSLVTQDKVGRNLAEKVGLATATKVGQLSKEAGEPTEEPNFTVAKKTNENESPLEETNEIVYKKPENREPEGLNEIVVTEDEDTEAEAKWHTKEVEEAEKKNLMPKLPKKKLAIVIGVLLILLLSVGFIFLPRAKAIVLVQAEKKSISLDFTGEKDAKIDKEKAIIPIQVVEATKESTKKYSATGKKDAGTKATGALTISNLSGNDISWVAGTRFSPTSNSSLIYRATSEVIVPKGGVPKTITVQADLPGDKYNGFGGQNYTLAAGGLAPTVLIVSSGAGMAGGTTKEVTYVTQSDYNTAKSNLAKEALTEAGAEFNKKVSELKVIDQSKKEETISSASDPKVGAEVSEFNVTVKVAVKALAFNLNDVNDLVKSEVERQFGYTKEIINDGSEGADISVTANDLVAGKFSATVKTEAYLSSKLDKEKIKSELVGSSSAKANEYLKALEGVDNVDLQFWPSFIKIFPRLKNHIYLDIKVSDNSVN